MNFREYKNEDGEKILSFIKSEREFRLWSANKYGSYPISSNDINKNYLECKKISNFYPFTLTMYLKKRQKEKHIFAKKID